MPKMKTHKGTARRFKITGSGLIMRTKGMKSHFRRRKSKRVKQEFAKIVLDVVYDGFKAQVGSAVNTAQR